LILVSSLEGGGCDAIDDMGEDVSDKKLLVYQTTIA
jgi:hypothetical protein